MKAYLRFRMPFEIARSFAENVRDTFHGQIQLADTKKPSEFHVTLAYFDIVDPDRISLMNDAIAAASLTCRDHRPVIKICGYDVFEEPRGNMLVALAEVDPFKVWEDRRNTILEMARSFAPEARAEKWNPHVTLGRIQKKKLKNVDADVPPYFSWKPDRVEHVLKFEHMKLIIPAWPLESKAA